MFARLPQHPAPRLPSTWAPPTCSCSPGLDRTLCWLNWIAGGRGNLSRRWAAPDELEAELTSVPAIFDPPISKSTLVLRQELHQGPRERAGRQGVMWGLGLLVQSCQHAGQHVCGHCFLSALTYASHQGKRMGVVATSLVTCSQAALGWLPSLHSSGHRASPGSPQPARTQVL